MKNQFNETLLSFMKNHMHRGDIVNVLMDVLYIGKEAAYRRMRGEVLFTFEEAAKISLKLGISLDSIIGIKHDERAVFDLNLYKSSSSKTFAESYRKTLEGYVEIFEKMGEVPDSEAFLAFNTLPYSLNTSTYGNLVRFRMYRWMHQSMAINAPTSLSAVKLPKELLSIQKQYNHCFQKIAKTHFILDRNAFTSFGKDITYFFKLNLINEEEIMVLKQEFLELIDQIEQLTKTGVNSLENEVLIYISNIDFEASYSYYQWGDFELSHVRMYSINSISSQDSVVCKIQREWIESLKRYSVLITQSGEIQRIEFFQEQREYINKIAV